AASRDPLPPRAGTAAGTRTRMGVASRYRREDPFEKFPSSCQHVTIPPVRDLQDAIERAQAHLLGQQAPDGHWVGQLEANTTITSEQLLLGHLIDQVNRDHQTRAVLYLKSQQLPDGGYNLFEA